MTHAVSYYTHTTEKRMCYHYVFITFISYFLSFFLVYYFTCYQRNARFKKYVLTCYFFVLFIDSYLSLSLSVYFYVASCHTILLVQLLRVRCTLLFKSVQNEIDCIDSLVQFVDGIFNMECAINL